MVPSYLPDLIEAIHAGMREEQDPRHIQTLATCLRALTQIQADYMSQTGGGSNPREALLSQLTGGGGAAAGAESGGAVPQAIPQYQGQG